MTTSIHNIDFAQLSLDERALLAHFLWDSIQRETESISVTAAQRAEIERRIAEADAGRMPSYPWEEVRQRLLDRNQ